MDETKPIQFNIAEEIKYYFDDSSIISSGQPEIVIIMGGVAVGKTTFRKVTLSLATLL